MSSEASTAYHAAPRRIRASGVRAALVFMLAGTLLALQLPALATVGPAAVRTQTQRLTTPGTTEPVRFGNAVAIDRDTMIVGADRYKAGGLAFSGAAFVYVWNGSEWELEDTLEPSDPEDDMRFGYAVAIEGDTAAVGAYWDDDGGTRPYRAGSVYVFERSGSEWSETKELTPPSGGQPSDWYGISASLSGERLLVGASETPTSSDIGTAYVYSRSGSDWVLEDTLTPADATPQSRFGKSVSLCGDSALVGAPSYDEPGETFVGAAYVFTRDGSTWNQQGQLLASDGQDFDRLGSSVALDGPLAIVGAPWNDEAGTLAGAAYVFGRDGAEWTERAKLLASDADPLDEFGTDVDLEGTTAIVGAYGWGNFTGSAYLFDGAGDSWTERDQLRSDPGDAFEELGEVVALSGDTAVAGAWNYGGARGAAYVFDGALGPFDPVELEGPTRYETAIAASQEAFPHGADTVVIATGENWPDALGGAALAGAYDAPILLTLTSTLPDAVSGEIERLGTTDAIILGGPGAVAPAVETALATKLGATNVRRLGGPTRYETAELIARAVESKVGANYDGTAFVATGLNFPDALAGSPLAAAGPWPILLAPATGMTPSTLATMSDIGVTDVLILGGTGVVSQTIEDGLESGVSGDATRLAGPTRYETAVEVASYGVDEAHLRWNGVALATGENFPDALAGGPMQGRARSVMLLTHTSFLTPATGAALQDEARDIAKVRFLGGPGAITPAVRESVAAILE